MSSYRPVDSKREEFRKYLEKCGALEALTKVLVMLYDEPEKPTDALDYIRKHLCDNRPDEAEMEVLKTDLEAALLKVQTLEDEIHVLNEKLAQYEPLKENPSSVAAEVPSERISTAQSHQKSVKSVEPPEDQEGAVENNAEPQEIV